jgi:hypothetical protein
MFPNRFPERTPVTTILIPGFGTTPIGDASNGVCGGMDYEESELWQSL